MDSLNSVWQSILAEISKNITSTAYNTWFADCSPVELGETLEVWTTVMAPAPTAEEPEREEEQPYLLASYTVADWLRVVRGEDGGITLTQLPEPTPAPEPEPPGPSLEEDMMTVLVDHEARLTAVETGVTL